MSYTINKTNGQFLITLLDGTANGPDINPGINVCDINLFGKNYPSYGLYQNENFIKLLQNFSKGTAPLSPLSGQLWYDSNSGFLKVYTGTDFKSVTPLTVTGSEPSSPSTGDQWWDTTNDQFKNFNGTDWTTIGPPYSKVDGITGAISEVVWDYTLTKHHVVKIYSNDRVTAIVSYDPAFTPNVEIPGFTTINPGITLNALNNNGLLYGTATNAQMLGNVAATQYARKDTDESFAGNVSTNSGAIEFNLSGTSATITNTVLSGNIEIYNNIGGTLTKTFEINGTTGRSRVTSNPVEDLEIAPKQYVDSEILSAALLLAPLNSPDLTGIPTAPTPPDFDVSEKIATTEFVDTAIAGKANIVSPVFTGTPLSVTPVTSDNSTKIATTEFVQSVVEPFATIESPIFTSNPRAPTPGSTDNSTRIATTEFAKGILNTAVALLAPKDSPILTGEPVAPTPTSGDNSTKLATTAFAQNMLLTALTSYAPLNSPTFTGAPLSVTPTPGSNSTAIATTAFVTTAVSTTGVLKANINSPTLTGTPLAPTPSTSDNSTKIATTAFTQAAITASTTSLWKGSNKFVSTAAPTPSSGAIGDFWFQI